jgi:hypothetical protein
MLTLYFYHQEATKKGSVSVQKRSLIVVVTGIAYEAISSRFNKFLVNASCV